MDETELFKKCFQRCLKCGKYIEDGEPSIIAYKYGIGEWFCKDHIDDAKKYLDLAFEFVDKNGVINKTHSINI